MKKVWLNCHIATMKHGTYSIIKDGSIITKNECIDWIGPRNEMPCLDIGKYETYDLDGAWVTPGLIDCHTHGVFGGNRSGEFEARLKGVSYAEIAQQGGGISSTVRATREASESDLFQSAKKRVQSLLKEGVTTIEIKSGYGLDLENERKMLKVIRQLADELPMTIRSTCLAAHALPPEFKNNADGYIDYICQKILPQLHQEHLIDAVDAFCEHLAFSPQQVEKVFQTAKSLNLPVKLHAEQLSALGGSSLAARYHALSADHLEFMTDQDILAMADADTVAVLLPGAFYFLRETQYPPVEKLIQQGVKIALSTDLNPGTSPVLSLRLMMNMGCTLFRLTPEQALAAVTIHAAQALDLAHRHGSLDIGKCADFVAWDIDHPSELSYWLGGDLNKKIIQKGQLLHL
ncbi:imidazolonepropionase [Acinetobacter equi]|uniref:Imidazolonepropionase n=1 Tax=Acinetobacter equi TaxID=1324350 RepID=A0A0N9VSB7_9GAMM|nr:imidazolonepropionase [Acinetobacter equi]ALH96270.1 imidazolonepropionase [Acinetobacter equi]